jgi:hypothetical protein
MMMSGSKTPKAIWLAEEERIAAGDAKRARAERRLAARPTAKRLAKVQSKPSDGFDAAASRLEAKAERDAADARAAKAARRAKAAQGDFGPKVVPGKRVVPDPLEPGSKLKATVNLAEHPLEMMLSRGRLTQAQYEAGIRFRAIYEHATIGPGRGIDPGKIKVDGGRAGDPLSDAVLHAHGELKRLAWALGLVGERVVSSICGAGLTVSELAKRWPTPDAERARMDYLTIRLREALDLLAEEVWGGKGPERGRIVGLRDLGSGVIDEQAVLAANQTHLRKRGISL